MHIKDNRGKTILEVINMPSRDEKSRLNFFEEESKNTSFLTTNMQGNTIFYKDNAFEMMSMPDGGAGNKEELDKLKRANK